MSKTYSKTRTLVECALMIALGTVLANIKIFEMPNGGSITLEMLPIILFAARYGCGWGSLAGLVYGTITYLIGNKFSVDWTTIICDYFIAFVALGFGAGLLSRRKWSVYYGTVIGGVIVAPKASELIFPLALAVEHRLTVDDVARAFTVYPSLSGSISDAARAMHIVL